MAESRRYRWFRRAGLTFLTALTVVPLYVMVSASLRPLAEVQGPFTWLPRTITLSPYHEMWTSVPLGRYVRNSMVVAGGTTVLCTLLAVLAAYALARFDFRGRRVFAAVVLATQGMPGLLFLVPLFLVLAQAQSRFGVQIIGSRAGLVVVCLSFALPFSIWLLAGYFATLSRSVEEAAHLDGLGSVATLWRVVLPAALPAVAAAAVFTFVLAWSEVLFASVLTDANSRTVAVGLQGYAAQSTAAWNQLMAAAVVTSLPAVAGFLAVQRHLVRGLASH